MKARYQSDKMSSLNDISWYSRNPSLLIAAGQFPYPYRPGMEMDLAADAATGAKSAPFRLPGIITLDWIPSFGISSYSTDPASIAAKEFYGRVRDAYSGSLDADAPDFMVYIGALDSIFTYVGWLKRIYRTISTYSPDNFMLPDALLSAYGFEYDYAHQYLRQHKVRFWQGINELILMSRKFTCPAVMDLFNRHYWMSDNVYADAPSPRAQLYVFDLQAVYKTQQVKEASSSNMVQGLKLTQIVKNYNNITEDNPDVVEGLISFGRSLIQALDAWDDGYTISGYLQRAFANVPSFTVAELLQDEKIEAQFVPEVLTQIENSRSVVQLNNNWGGVVSDACANNIVTQNVLTNAVVSSPNFTHMVTVGTGEQEWFDQLTRITNALPNLISPALNLHVEAPTVADNVIASRLQAYTIADPVASTTTGIIGNVTYTIEAGTEIVLYYTTIVPGSSARKVTWAKQFLSQVLADNLYYGATAATALTTEEGWNALIEQFASHPILYSVTSSLTGNASAVTVLPHGDIFNFTKISPEMLQNLHKVCFYSELNAFGIE